MCHQSVDAQKPRDYKQHGKHPEREPLKHKYHLSRESPSQVNREREGHDHDRQENSPVCQISMHGLIEKTGDIGAHLSNVKRTIMVTARNLILQ